MSLACPFCTGKIGKRVFHSPLQLKGYYFSIYLCKCGALCKNDIYRARRVWINLENEVREEPTLPTDEVKIATQSLWRRLLDRIQ